MARLIGEIVIVLLLAVGAGSAFILAVEPKIRRQVVNIIKGWFA